MLTDSGITYSPGNVEQDGVEQSKREAEKIGRS